MSQVKFDQDNTVNTPKKILDCGPSGAFIHLQVLDASTLFYDIARDQLEVSGLGLAAPNATQGFQLKAANGILLTWWKGELWGRSDAQGAIISAAIVFKLKGRGNAGVDYDAPPPLTDEL